MMRLLNQFHSKGLIPLPTSLDIFLLLMLRFHKCSCTMPLSFREVAVDAAVYKTRSRDRTRKPTVPQMPCALLENRLVLRVIATKFTGFLYVQDSTSLNRIHVLGRFYHDFTTVFT